MVIKCLCMSICLYFNFMPHLFVPNFIIWGNGKSRFHSWSRIFPAHAVNMRKREREWESEAFPGPFQGTGTGTGTKIWFPFPFTAHSCSVHSRSPFTINKKYAKKAFPFPFLFTCSGLVHGPVHCFVHSFWASFTVPFTRFWSHGPTRDLLLLDMVCKWVNVPVFALIFV